jgi:LysM repeat protein
VINPWVHYQRHPWQQSFGAAAAHAAPKAPVSGTAVADLDDPPIGWALLTAPSRPALSVLCELGDTPPCPTDGYGGWQPVDKQRDLGLAIWQGFRPMAIDMPLMLDNFAAGESVEDAFHVLEAMAGRGPRRQGVTTGQRFEPPELVVNTGGVMLQDAHVSPGGRWVIANLQVDDQSIEVNSHGNWTRVAVIVSLLEHEQAGTLATQTAEARKRIAASAPSVRVTYKSKSGDTLLSIARSQLHDSSRWPELATLNHLRDPRAKIKTNTNIRLPG